ALSCSGMVKHCPYPGNRPGGTCAGKTIVCGIDPRKFSLLLALFGRHDFVPGGNVPVLLCDEYFDDAGYNHHIWTRNDMYDAVLTVAISTYAGVVCLHGAGIDSGYCGQHDSYGCHKAQLAAVPQ